MTFIKRNKSVPKGTNMAVAAIFVLMIVALLCGYSRGISGNDFWWHIKVGQWILENGQIPSSDIFSWYGTANQIPWVAHEWLSDVVFYLLYDCVGSVGVFLFSVASAFAMLMLLWKQSRQYIEKNLLIGGLYFALLAVTTSVFFYGRPHLFSFFLLFFELKILYGFLEKPETKQIFWIPLIACVWSNIHGGSSNLSYLLCIMFLVMGVFKVEIGCIQPQPLSRSALIRLAIVLALSVLAVMLNPFGVKMLLYPYENMGDKLMLSVIREWHAPDAKDLGELILYYVPVALMLIGFFAEKHRIRLIDGATMGVFILLFLRSVRFIMLWYIAAAFCAIPYMPVCKIKQIGPKTEKILAGFCVILVAATLVVVGDGLNETAKEGQLISTVMPEEAITAVSEDKPERLFNDYNLGEALIQNDIPVFFDARADVYAYENLLADGVGLMLMEQLNPDAGQAYLDVDALIRKYDFDAFLILKSRPLYAYLISHPDRYDCVYEDGTVAYFTVDGF